MDQIHEQIEFYQSKVAEWVKQGHAGEFVVVADQKLVGFRSDFAQAYMLGSEEHIPGTFLVREVRLHEPVQHVNRLFLNDTPFLVRGGRLV